MTPDIISLVFVLFLIVAMLYAAVGHAGASGYLAVMALLSFEPAAIKPTSLILNIFVAAIASYHFIRAGQFDMKIFLSFIVTALPMAYVGGYITVNPGYFKLFAGVFLVVSAVLLMLREYMRQATTEPRSLPLPWSLGIGSVIGLFSGLIGVGGGIFLSPVLIMANLTTVKKASGIAALFILCNSIAGLAGHISSVNKIDFNIVFWIAAVVTGGFVGSYFGTKSLNSKWIVTVLFVVLLTAGAKFIFVDFGK